MTFAEMIRGLPSETFKSDMVCIKPIKDDDDLWYATVECRLTDEQWDYVNPAGFSIGRAYLNPSDNVPCVITTANGERIGYIVLRMWLGEGAAFNWSYYIDKSRQGQGFGRESAKLAVRILKAADPKMPIKLSTEQANKKAQRLYLSMGFKETSERDGDDIVYVI